MLVGIHGTKCDLSTSSISQWGFLTVQNTTSWFKQYPNTCKYLWNNKLFVHILFYHLAILLVIVVCNDSPDPPWHILTIKKYFSLLSPTCPLWEMLKKRRLSGGPILSRPGRAAFHPDLRWKMLTEHHLQFLQCSEGTPRRKTCQVKIDIPI